MVYCECGQILESILVSIPGEDAYVELLCKHCNYPKSHEHDHTRLRLSSASASVASSAVLLPEGEVIITADDANRMNQLRFKFNKKVAGFHRLTVSEVIGGWKTFKLGEVDLEYGETAHMNFADFSIRAYLTK